MAMNFTRHGHTSATDLGGHVRARNGQNNSHGHISPARGHMATDGRRPLVKVTIRTTLTAAHRTPGHAAIVSGVGQPSKGAARNGQSCRRPVSWTLTHLVVRTQQKGPVRRPALVTWPYGHSYNRTPNLKTT
jgi:hypothetical protein